MIGGHNNRCGGNRHNHLIIFQNPALHKTEKFEMDYLLVKHHLPKLNQDRISKLSKHIMSAF